MTEQPSKRRIKIPSIPRIPQEEPYDWSSYSAQLPRFVVDNLPPGWHRATVAEFRRRCVEEFPPHCRPDKARGCPHRERLFEGYLKLHDALSSLNIPTEQWIGGSFVSTAAHPNDIDVVNFCDVEAYEGLPPELRALLERYFDAEATARHCHCNSHLVTKGPPTHPCNADYLKMHNFWHKRFAYDKDQRPRGIVGIYIQTPTPEEDAPDAKP